MQRRVRDSRRPRRLALSRETLLDLEPSDEQTAAVRGGTGLPGETQTPSYCYACDQRVPPTRQTYPPTGDVCPTPKKGGRYRVVHTVETEYVYRLLDFEEGEKYRTDTFLIDEVTTRILDTTTEELPPD